MIELFVIRNGQNLGSRTLQPTHGGDAGEDELLRAFLPQHYLPRAGRERPVPDEILLSHATEGTEVLEQALGEQTGRKISIRSNVRGNRARWIAMAVDNAELSLQQRIASRGKPARPIRRIAGTARTRRTATADRVLRRKPHQRRIDGRRLCRLRARRREEVGLSPFQRHGRQGGRRLWSDAQCARAPVHAAAARGCGTPGSAADRRRTGTARAGSRRARGAAGIRYPDRRSARKEPPASRDWNDSFFPDVPRRSWRRRIRPRCT